MLIEAVCLRGAFYSRSVARCTWESWGGLWAASRVPPCAGWVWAQEQYLSPEKNSVHIWKWACVNGYCSSPGKLGITALKCLWCPILRLPVIPSPWPPLAGTSGSWETPSLKSCVCHNPDGTRAKPATSPGSGAVGFELFLYIKKVISLFSVSLV